MSEILDKFAACERVTEWIDPWDERLVIATGEQAPNRGCQLRDDWHEPQEDWPRIEAEVKRLIVPLEMASKVVAKLVGEEEMPEDWNRVILDVPGLDDWSRCFPINEQTRISPSERVRAWVGLGICGNILGLAVFSQETAAQGIEARVQLVPEDIFRKIVT